jgi:DNA-binding CsgD family transcriptional regulator
MPAGLIARRHGISPTTVRKHLEHIYTKLDAHDRLLAVNRAREFGLLARRPA